MAITTLSRGTLLIELADNFFGAVDRGRVEQIDPQVQGLADQSDGFGLALAGSEAEAAEAAAAEAGDADPKPGSAERHVFHSIEHRALRTFDSKERKIETNWQKPQMARRDMA